MKWIFNHTTPHLSPLHLEMKEEHPIRTQQVNSAKNKFVLVLPRLIPKACQICTSCLIQDATKHWTLHCVNRKSVEQELRRLSPHPTANSPSHLYSPVSMQGAIRSWLIFPCKFEVSTHLQESRERYVFTQWPLNMIFLSSLPMWAPSPRSSAAGN